MENIINNCFSIFSCISLTTIGIVLCIINADNGYVSFVHTDMCCCCIPSENNDDYEFIP